MAINGEKSFVAYCCKFFWLFWCFSLFFSGHQNLLSGHQKMKIEDFGGPNGPPTKKVSVEPWYNVQNIVTHSSMLSQLGSFVSYWTTHHLQTWKESQVRQEKLFVVPPVLTKIYGERTFAHSAPIMWNNLPDALRSINSMENFKSALKTYLFELSMWYHEPIQCLPTSFFLQRIETCLAKCYARYKNC